MPETTQLYALAALQGGNPQSRRQQGHAPSGGPRGESVPRLSPSVGGSRHPLAFLGLRSLPPCSRGILPVGLPPTRLPSCKSVSMFSLLFLKGRQSDWIRVHPKTSSSVDYSCKRLISKRGRIHEGLGLPFIGGGYTIQPIKVWKKEVHRGRGIRIDWHLPRS